MARSATASVSDKVDDDNDVPSPLIDINSEVIVVVTGCGRRGQVAKMHMDNAVV